MSFDPGPGREAERRRLLAEIRAGRERQLRLLAREYRPVAERLRDAYEGARGEINAFIRTIPDALNPVGTGTLRDDALQRTLEDFQAVVTRELGVLEQAILDEAPDLQRGGARIGAEVGARNLQQAGVTTRFNRATVEAIQAAIDYVDRPEFRLTVGNLGRYHGEQAADLIISAVAAGRNPREIAPIIAEYFTSSGRPMQDALRLTRTTQIYSARSGTREIYARHGVRQWMWSSALDTNTCVSCWSLHGSLHPVDELLNDHHNGRCAPVPVTPRWEELGLSGVDPGWETGPQAFERLTEEQQRNIMGPQLYEAWRRNEFQFTPEVVSTTYENDIFGTMRRRRSNAEILAR